MIYLGIDCGTQSTKTIALDRQGNVIRPAKLWCDTSTTAECDAFRHHFGGAQALIEKVGLDMLPGYTAPKILWLKHHEPGNFARMTTVLLPHDYINFSLTGRFAMEYGDASGTALLDVRTRTWSRDVLDFIDPTLEKKMPRLQSSLTPCGILLDQLAHKWGLPIDVQVSAGGGDNMMGAIGTGNVEPGRVTASLGTSGTIYAYSEKPVIDPGGEIAGFCDSTDAWLPLVCTMNVTVATEAVCRLFHWTHAQFDEAVGSVPPGADGLLFLPYLQGERTPNLPNGTGVLHGLTTRNMTPAHLARATVEGVTLGLAYGLRRLRSLGIAPNEIRLTGGGSHSAAWRRICADIFGCRVVTLVESEGAALGAAIQALAAADPSRSVRAWSNQIVRVKTADTAEPQTSFDYTAALEKQSSLARALSDRALSDRGFL
jgi:D-xylulose kinase